MAPEPSSASLVARPRNPKRAAHPPEVQQVAVAAVIKLLETTTMSLTAAVTDVASGIGAGTTTVMRWCRREGVGRTTSDLEREYEARYNTLREINQRLAEEMRDRIQLDGRP